MSLFKPYSLRKLGHLVSFIHFIRSLREVERESSREGAKGLEGRKLEEPRGDRDSRS